MASQFQGSDFWLNFGSLKRKVKNGVSPWSKFHSPYDLQKSTEEEEEEEEHSAANSSHSEILPRSQALSSSPSESIHDQRSPPPSPPHSTLLLSPTRGRRRSRRRNKSEPLRPSCPGQNWNGDPSFTPPTSTTDRSGKESESIPRACNDPPVSSSSSSPSSRQGEGKVFQKMGEREDPWVALILNGLVRLPENGGRSSVMDASEMSRSTEELQVVRDRWLKELDCYRVEPATSKSQDSLIVRPDNDAAAAAAAAVQGSSSSPMSSRSRSLVLSQLGRITSILDGNGPKRKGESPSRNNDGLGSKLKVARRKGSVTDDKNQTHSNFCNCNSGTTTNAKSVTLSLSDSHITVRPGVRIPRSRSYESNLRNRIAPTSSDQDTLVLNAVRKSKASNDAKLNHQDSMHYGSLQRCPRIKSRVTVRQVETDPEDEVFETIPQVPELKFNKYNFRRHLSTRSAVSKGPLTPLKAGQELAQARRERNSVEGSRGSEDALERGVRLETAGNGSSAFKTSRKTLLKSALCLRSKSVDRHFRCASPKNSQPKNMTNRRCVEGRVTFGDETPRVVSEEENGRYRGLIFDGTSSARTGTFPGNLVHRRDIQVGGMSGRGKPAAAVKVSPPTVPDAALTHRHSGSSFSSGVYSAGDQRSSYSSSVSDDNPPPSPRSPARVNCDHGQLGRVGTNNPNNNNNNSNSSNNTTNNNGQHGNNSPSHFHNQQFTFPNQGGVPQFAHLMCPKTSPGSPHHVPPDSTYTYLTYQQQTSLEDQGIDVQSPGRSSPGSGSGSSTTGSTASSGGCRNSTTSLDSGRASTSTHTHQHRLSGQSYDSGSILRHSYHSSSSSLGSMEHDGTPHVNVPELLNNGVRDSEVLRAWLTDIRSEEYYEKFILAGYDMPTISRMTPEDLNAIGITKPAHRKKLKAEITKLNISDRLPNFIPGRLEDWLSLLRLEEYTTSLKQQGYTSVEQMTQLTWEDLEDIGITKLGHQKKVMLAIKRVKDIMAGKKFASAQDTRPQNQYGTHEIMISREAGDGREQFSAVPEFRTFAGPVHPNAGDLNRLSGPADPGGHYGVPNHYAPGVQYGPMGPPQAHVQPMPHQSSPYISSGQYGGPQGPSPPGGKVHSGSSHPLPGPGQVQYRPDVVAVQIRPGGRGRSAESLEEPIYGTYQTFHPDSRLSLSQGPSSLGSLPPRPFPPPSMMTSHPQRSMDDGDITPTNEFAGSYEGGGTLPRPRTANKLRPVAKVTAKTRVDIHEVPQFIKDGMNLKKPSQVEEVGMKDLNVKTLNRQNSEKISSSQGSGSTNNTPQGTPKKLPPPPPRRSNSISESSKDAVIRDGQHGYLKRGLSYGYMGIKNNLQPDVTPDLPPPPAPPDSANHQHLPDDFPPPPPPLTCVTMASTSRITSTITTASITSDSLATSQTSTSATEEVSPSFRPRRNDSNASFKSTSSTDSDSLPFANENAGTIKQRACRPHPGLSVLDTRNSPHSSPRSSPALRRKDAQIPLRQTSLTDTEPSSDCTGNPESGSPDGTGDVLNDIGNMLANLTDELDAMLEQELVLKN